MIKKNFSVVFIFASMFFIDSDATRTNPRVGRSVWRVIRDSTPEPIEALDAISGVITISMAGNYQLYENLQNILFVIDASCVCLDLNGHEISSDDETSNLITINASDVKICNGSVVNTSELQKTGSGILLNSGVTDVFLENLYVSNFNNGVFLEGNFDNNIFDCKFMNLCLVRNNIGMKLLYASKNKIQNCKAAYNSVSGFDSLYSKENIFQDNSALKNIGDSTVCGFKTDSGSGNLFQNCVAKKTITSAWEFCNKSYGFLLTGTEEKTKIIECIVNETDMTSTVSATSYGIHLEQTLIDSSENLLEQIDSASTLGYPYFVAWSPNSRYLAVTQAGGYLEIFGFDGFKLASIDLNDSFDPTHTGDVYSVAWSPDGKYLSIGGDGVSGSLVLHVFKFDGSILEHVESIVVYNYIGSYAEITSVAWSPDGQCIAIGWGFEEKGVDVSSIDVYDFHSESLQFIDSYYITDAPSPVSISWSPDGRYIAASFLSNGDVYIFNFDGGNIVEIDSIYNLEDYIFSIEWSPDGKHIAFCGRTGVEPLIVILNFGGQMVQDIHTSTFISTYGNIRSISWSPCGKYLATLSTSGFIQILSFDGEILVVEETNYLDIASILSIDWSPCGKYLAVTNGSDDLIYTFNVMYGPENCLIKDCTVCDVSSFNTFVGKGIAGAGTNKFFGNICYNNEVDFTFGVPNVFFGDHNTFRPFDNIANQIPNFLIQEDVNGGGEF